MEKMMIKNDNSPKWMKIGKKLLIIIWAAIILVFLIKRKDITVEGILNDTPENPIWAVFMMLGLFALKSLSIVIYSGILYVINGILFPLPAAIIMNICGSAVMVMLPHMITFPVMGMNITNPHSHEFIVSLCIEVVIMIGTATAYVFNKKRQKRKGI